MTRADRPASRLATRIAFLVTGFGVSCWAPLVPFAKQRLQVDDGTLGLLLLCLGVGSVGAMLRAGPLCARYGCKPLVLGGGAGIVLLLPALGVVSSPWLLALALIGFGASLGTIEVAMNVHAVIVERDAGTPLMSGFHAMFSLGAFAGAGVITFLLSHAMHPLPATLICSAIMLLALWIASSRLLTGTQAPDSGELLVIPRGPVVLLAALTALLFLVEGALLDWGALFLTDSGLSVAAHAGIGYAVFSVAMTVGRLSGDAVTARLGDYSVMLWGSILAIGGFLLLLFAPTISVALVAFVLIGLGASNIVPVLFRKASMQTVMPAALAISAISTSGYAGHLMGPAGVGFISKLAGLHAAFWVLTALMCLVPLSAGKATRTATQA